MLVASFALAACGGSGGTADPVTVAPTQTTGTVGLLLTDAPSDDFSSIRLNVTEAILIGGDDGQQLLFQGSEPIDLLDLTNFSEPVVFGETAVGNYKKLRLVIDELELIPIDGGPSIFPALPANGKIDLLQSSGFDVLPGTTLLIEIDIDANKSIKITGAGNSQRVNFRPVVKVKIVSGDELPHKLARLEGSVESINSDGTGEFVLCDIDSPEYCVTISTNAESSFFDIAGLGTDFSSLMVGDMLVVFGRYQTEPDIVLNAAVVEIGGNSEQVKGNVVSAPADSEFLVLADDDTDLLVELQPGTKYYDASGEVLADAVILGVDVEVEGVRVEKDDAADPDRIRAALIFLEAEEDEQLSGTIVEPLDATARSFDLQRDDASTVCVRVDDDAAILLVDITLSEVTAGSFDDLAAGQMADIFGETAEDECFDANEVIVEITAEAT